MQDEVKTCRICLDDEGEMIAPCGCTGSHRFVHRACLDRWRSNVDIPLAFSSCEVCRTPFLFEEGSQARPASFADKLLTGMELLVEFTWLLAGVTVASSFLGFFFLYWFDQSWSLCYSQCFPAQDNSTCTTCTPYRGVLMRDVENENGIYLLGGFILFLACVAVASMCGCMHVRRPVNRVESSGSG